MTNPKINQKEAADLIHSTKGSVPPLPFSVTFKRRTDKYEKCSACTKGTPGAASCTNCGGKGKILVEAAGSLREMVCFLGSNIKKGLAGGPAAYNPTTYDLIWVYCSNLDKNFEEDPRHRRSISVDGLVKLKVRGIEYEVEAPVDPVVETI